MAFNGSGLFVRVYNWITDRDASVKIRADRMDAEMDGFATGLSTCITKDGQTTITADLPMNSRKLTGLGDGTASGNSVHFGQIRERLSANRIYYVKNSSPGSDSNSGLTTLLPFLTIQKAWDTICDKIDLNGYNVTISLIGGSGVTYTAGLTSSKAPVGNSGWSTVTLDGGDATLNVTGDHCINLGEQNGFGGMPNFNTANITLRTTTSGNCINVKSGVVTIQPGTVFGACAGAHIVAGHTTAQVYVTSRTVSGGAVIGIEAYAGGYVVEENATVTFSAPVTFSSAYLALTAGGIGQFAGCTYVNPGNVTGTRFVIDKGSDVTTGGSISTFFPGTIAGTIDDTSSFDGVAGSSSTVVYKGSSSGTTTVQASAAASGTLTLPAATDTLVGKATTDELTNKTLTTAVGKGTWTASGTWTLPAHTLGGTVSGGGNQVNNVIIGTSTPLAGSFTTLGASGLISADGGQIAFPATQNASAGANTLDDYEEGTWTPDVKNSSSTSTWGTKTGYYRKIGGMVTEWFYCDSGNSGTGGSALTLSGLPFSVVSLGATMIMGGAGGSGGTVYNVWKDGSLTFGATQQTSQLTFVSGFVTYPAA